jgi:hypothetical protein
MESMALSFPVNTVLFAGIPGLMKVCLGLRVTLYRMRMSISLGDRDDETMLRRIRADANFSENVPMALILLMLIEMLHATSLAIFVLGIVLVIGRLLHWLGLSGNAEPFNRVTGMVMTWGVIAVASVMAIWLYATSGGT